MSDIDWNSCEDDQPEIGNYMVTVDTDGGREVHTLHFDGNDWLHEGEPTFCHGYYFSPLFWAELPEPCMDAVIGESEDD